MTVPYVAGTVSVTAGSAVVTGSGTGWQTALVAGGLFGLDSSNGNPVPILSVDSNTQITLAKPWRGTTAAAQPYWIIRDTDAGRQTVANASGLAQIISELRSTALAAFAGLVPSSGKVPFFNGAATATLTDMGSKGQELLAAGSSVAAYAALGEVPNGQLPGRLQAAPIAVADPNDVSASGYYAIGSNTPNAPEAASMLLEHIQYSSAQARQFAYRHSNTAAYTRVRSAGVWQAWERVSDEYGSNGNGEYWRFGNGFLMCKTTVTLSADTVFDTNFYLQSDGGNSWTFPAAFAGVAPDVTLNKTGAAGALWGYASSISTSSCLLAPIASRVRSGQVFIATAKGRWF